MRAIDGPLIPSAQSRRGPFAHAAAGGSGDPGGAEKVRDVVSDFRAGRLWGLARAISIVERRDEQSIELLQTLCAEVRLAPVAGLTGPPGAGKSTIADSLVHALRERDESVAILAVDPNSPFSGGALLGDRVRMRQHLHDPKVFMRSMGARGHLGGVARATTDAIRLLSAFGFDRILLETVGVGQSETEIASVADTTILVLTPGQGDSVQMLKAGVMEIADIFVVNKSDHAGARTTARQVRHSLNIGPRSSWRPPIVMTIATTASGIGGLMDALDRHHAHAAASGDLARRRSQRLQLEVADLVAAWAVSRTRGLLNEDGELAARLTTTGSPYSTADEIINRMQKRVRKPVSEDSGRR